MSTTLIVMNQLLTLLTEATAIAVGDAYALPARVGTLTWQTNLNTTPATFDAQLEVSLDGVEWHPLVAIDETDFTSDVNITVYDTPVAFKKIRLNIVANSTPAEVTSTILIKPRI